MKILGMIGGIGPESTIDYYKEIIAIYRSQKPDGSYPPLIINSIDAKKMIDLITVNAWPEVTQLLAGELKILSRAGADFGLVAANTPHIIFDDLQRQSPLPLLSIVTCACRFAKKLGLKKVGLFGTRFTMQGRFYPDVFSREGIALAVPDARDQDYIHDKYMGELFNGMFLPETREGLLAIVDRMKASGIEGLILGGTELPLILRDDCGRGIPFLDTTRIHAEAAVAEMLH